MTVFVGAFVQIAVKHREADKEGQADQILDPLDVLVEVHQGVDLVPFADLVQQVHDVTSSSLRGSGLGVDGGLCFGLDCREPCQSLDEPDQQHDRWHQLNDYQQRAKGQKDSDQQAARLGLRCVDRKGRDTAGKGHHDGQ
jgi:hypothetical protein